MPIQQPLSREEAEEFSKRLGISESAGEDGLERLIDAGLEHVRKIMGESPFTVSGIDQEALREPFVIELTQHQGIISELSASNTARVSSGLPPALGVAGSNLLGGDADERTYIANQGFRAFGVMIPRHDAEQAALGYRAGMQTAKERGWHLWSAGTQGRDKSVFGQGPVRAIRPGILKQIHKALGPGESFDAFTRRIPMIASAVSMEYDPNWIDDARRASVHSAMREKPGREDFSYESTRLEYERYVDREVKRPRGAVHVAYTRPVDLAMRPEGNEYLFSTRRLVEDLARRRLVFASSILADVADRHVQDGRLIQYGIVQAEGLLDSLPSKDQEAGRYAIEMLESGLHCDVAYYPGEERMLSIDPGVFSANLARIMGADARLFRQYVTGNATELLLEQLDRRNDYEPLRIGRSTHV